MFVSYGNASTTTFHKTLRIADFAFPQLHDFPALVLESIMRNNLIRRELEGYDRNTLQAIIDQEDQLNDGQRAIFDKIIQMANVPDQDNKLFFIDGPGGTRKSTLLRLYSALDVEDTSQVDQQVDLCDLQAVPFHETTVAGLHIRSTSTLVQHALTNTFGWATCSVATTHNRKQYY
ncbi:unnamed protein product [Phytophthora fragariaefolia]|uniref:Unnamed protein product n=1 Tax=Phytophthora fragariaefolia TaxID=1490495 RepID=A0A9W6XU95_9STRA|nr:unnamed protein product [Phytophthora fragariaefolia]